MQNHLTIKSCLAAVGLAMVASTSLQAQNFNPIPLTPASFTQEIVIPLDWTYKLNAQSVTATYDGGPQLQTNSVAGYPPYYSLDSGDTMFEVGMNRSSANASNFWGMPVGGSTFTNVTENTAANKHVYTLGYWTNYSSNAFLVCGYSTNNTYNEGLPLGDGPYVGKSYTNVNITLNNSTPYTALSFVGSTGSGPEVSTMTISYADGTSQTVSGFGIPDWFNTSVTNTSVTPNATFAYTCQCRCNPTESANTFTVSSAVSTGSRLWSMDVALSDSNSPATNVNLSYVSGGRGVIYGVSGSANPLDNATIPNTAPLTGPFAPISVSGFNAGMVVANSPQNLAGLAPLTAVMDNGTNLAAGGNTFFEKGWDAAAPTNGFPVHGTILQSGANPTRFYQMPASYHAPMCILIDTNHQFANITPQTPGQYAAISLLTCGASIGAANTMTNYCILQHSDGVNESNVFYGYDWFNTTQPYAYTANERCNVGSSTSTTGREVQNLDSTDPRLFESEFQTADSTPVTNIQVGFRQAGGNNWATYVIAVSATTNFIPVQVGSYTPVQNVYAGSSAVYNVAVPFGSRPISYQWQKTDGATYTNNLSDGMNASGSTYAGSLTSNLTISSVSAADEGFYTCLMSNQAGSTNSPDAPLTLLFATGTNVVQAGDPISDFYGAPPSTPGEAYPSPAGLTVNFAIDQTDQQYLNYGASGTNTSFEGPVGIIIEPSAGDSIVTGARFIVPVNAAICDPADFSLDGSIDGIFWTNILPDTALNLPNLRNLVQTAPVNITNQFLQEISFRNTTNYNYYRVTVQNVKGGATANSMQIGEIQLLGTLALLPPGIFTQPTPPVQNLAEGGSITWSIKADGPPPITYQWEEYVGGTSTAISGATNTTYTLANATVAANSGFFYCVASNPYGSTTSAVVQVDVSGLTSTYESTVVADGPIAFFRLDEGPDNGAGNDGTIAHDIMGGHNGYYSNAVLQVTGYSSSDSDDYAAQFGLLQDPAANNLVQDNCVAGINGVNFFSPTNTSTNLSVEAWVSLSGSVSGAGIVSKGYGGGGEEFALDTGGTGNAFRFYFRNAGAASFTVSPNVAPLFDNWYHVVGVLNQSSNVEYLYTNGVLAATTVLSPAAKQGIFSNDIAPVLIGARSSASTTNYNLQLDGAVDNVAIYNYALTAAQVANHYLAIGVAPTFTVVPTNTTVLLGQSAPAVFYSMAFGTSNSVSPLVYQWSYNGQNLTNGPSPTGTGAIISGATTPTLTISGATIADNNDTFTITVTNIYGNISAQATLSVAAGPPVIAIDVQSPISVFVGTPASISASFTGSLPFTYQWTYNGKPLTNNARISGATNNTLVINPTLFTDSGTYQLDVSNIYGPGQSSQAALTVLPILTFDGFGTGWSLNSSGISSPGYPSANTLELTDGSGSEARSSFFSNALYVGAFQATYTYTDVNGDGANADGACFVLQNDPRGPAALGGGGGSLGYSGITPSISLQFNLYLGNVYGGVGVGFGENGAVAEVTDPSPVVINYGDPINVTLNYIGGVASLFLQDAVETNLTYSATADVNIPALLGTNVAYVGFTGADGGTASIQTIANFQFISLVDLTAQISGGNITLSWPTGSSAYQLESNSNLANTNGWVNVSAQPTVANEQNQVTVPVASSGQVFYRLQLQ